MKTSGQFFKGGLMYEASVGGRTFKYTSKK
jgi:hypothetical protein